MQFKQQLIKKLYPVLKNVLKTDNTSKVLVNTTHQAPSQSFYTLKATSILGRDIDFKSYKGKKILIVNTASACGFTPQFAALQKLHEQFGDKVVIIGFPSNDFKEQDKGSDQDIHSFCQVNYGVTFLMMQKGIVIKNEKQQEVYQWLTNPYLNGWNSQQPDWNFSKYLINEEGMLTNYFGPAIDPMDDSIVELFRCTQAFLQLFNVDYSKIKAPQNFWGAFIEKRIEVN